MASRLNVPHVAPHPFVPARPVGTVRRDDTPRPLVRLADVGGQPLHRLVASSRAAPNLLREIALHGGWIDGFLLAERTQPASVCVANAARCRSATISVSLPVLRPALRLDVLRCGREET